MRKLLIFLITAPVVVCLSSTSIDAGELEDIAAAERLIKIIEIAKTADERAYWRAVKALAGTAEGIAQMKKCELRDHELLWGTCMTDDEWDFHGAYRPLYDKYYDEELNILLDETALQVEQQDLDDLLKR